MKVVSDVLLLSYLHKFGLRVTVEAGQALACLYSEARLFKGLSLAGPSQSATTRSTGNISVWIKKVGGYQLYKMLSCIYKTSSIQPSPHPMCKPLV